mmetsp:Transcript_17966/g.28114  ORF Transcript_17966/g.28114 Transcript_17966/m.28114 type:complete len:253 (+) Transcript_17966:21-779(+)
MASQRSSYDRFISVFSPEGKLYQVEYATNAVNSAGATAIAIAGENCAVIVGQKKVKEPLIVSDSANSIFHIHSGIGVCAMGRRADATSAVRQCREDAAEYWFHHGMPCSSLRISQRYADSVQVSTQNAGKRILGVSMVFVGMDTNTNGDPVPLLHKVDPSGYCISYNAVAVGIHEKEAMKILEKESQRESFHRETDINKLLSKAISCLLRVTKEEFKKDDLEIGLISASQPDFRLLESEDVESVLEKNRRLP